MDCDSDHFKCLKLPYNCVTLSQMCDGNPDCGALDESDEDKYYCDLYEPTSWLNLLWPLYLAISIIVAIGIFASIAVCYYTTRRRARRGAQPMVVITGAQPTPAPTGAANQINDPYQPMIVVTGATPTPAPTVAANQTNYPNQQTVPGKSTHKWNSWR